MQIPQKDIVINSRKYDRKIQKSWTADLIEARDSLLVFLGVFDRPVNHPFLGVIRPGTISYEFYWLDRWFNVFRFHEPGGEFRNYYCNINLPPVFQNGILDYIDLDIDVIVEKDFSYTILDLDEFEANSLKFRYALEILAGVETHLKILLQKIENREFPFDYQPGLSA